MTHSSPFSRLWIIAFHRAEVGLPIITSNGKKAFSQHSHTYSIPAETHGRHSAPSVRTGVVPDGERRSDRK